MRPEHILSVLIITAVILVTPFSGIAEGKKDVPKKTDAVETYTSGHGFSIDYPKGWKLVTYMEEYETLEDAEKDAGNYFSIQSYQDDDPRIRGYHYFPADTLKIEAWVYPDYGGTLAELITQTKDITRIDDFTIGGKKAKKVWQKVGEGVDAGDDIYSIYFVDDGKRAIFTCYPIYTSLKDKFEEIVGSFRFEKAGRKK
ncbi:MAG TPA: PsbP-related protein [Thermodesulfobacteriota bacterium]|nr:PsbP-related protein [Thermodesulfobacteriota bacterium]